MCIAAYDDENDFDDIHRLAVKYKIARATIQRSVTCVALLNNDRDLPIYFPSYFHDVGISIEGENQIIFLPLCRPLSPTVR
jgi:hypothetical protein